MKEIKKIYRIIHNMKLDNIIENNKNLILLTDKYYQEKNKEIFSLQEKITIMQIDLRKLEKRHRLCKQYSIGFIERFFSIFTQEKKINELKEILEAFIIEMKTNKSILSHHLKKIEKFQKTKIIFLIDQELDKNIEYRNLKEKIKEIEDESIYTYNLPKLNNIINQIKVLKDSLSNFEEFYEDMIDSIQDENEFDKKMKNIFDKIKIKINRLNDNIEKVYLKNVYNKKISNNVQANNIQLLLNDLNKVENKISKDLGSLENEKNMRTSKYKFALNEMKADLYEKIGL